ncbi:MAG: methyltransferase domain-containing protein [Planctomycetes bacterium]|nr:methyltransferase domain-containing protein [Planctomycetota bacterium]
MLLSGLRARARIPELMDDPALDPAAHRRALAGLARLNRFSNSAGVLWPPIRKLARELKRTVRVLDVATGSGDVPRALLRRANRAGVALEVAACDLSPTAIAEANRAPGPIRFFVHDALHAALPTGFDVVTSSLFLHHLSEDEAIALLVNMENAAARLVLVNDLARSRFNFCAVWAACRLLSRSPVVRFDGPASVRSAFTAREGLALAERAGLHGATVRGRFPCRYLLSWERT